MLDFINLNSKLFVTRKELLALPLSSVSLLKILASQSLRLVAEMLALSSMLLVGELSYRITISLQDSFY